MALKNISLAFCLYPDLGSVIQDLANKENLISTMLEINGCAGILYQALEVKAKEQSV